MVGLLDLQIRSNHEWWRRRNPHTKQIRNDCPHAIILIEDDTLTHADIKGLMDTVRIPPMVGKPGTAATKFVAPSTNCHTIMSPGKSPQIL